MKMEKRICSLEERSKEIIKPEEKQEKCFRKKKGMDLQESMKHIENINYM